MCSYHPEPGNSITEPAWRKTQATDIANLSAAEAERAGKGTRPGTWPRRQAGSSFEAQSPKILWKNPEPPPWLASSPEIAA